MQSGYWLAMAPGVDVCVTSRSLARAVGFGDGHVS